MNNNSLYILIIVVLLLIGGGVFWFAMNTTPSEPSINNNGNTVVANFEECVAAGNPVMESYPRQCRAANGQTYTENIGNAVEKADLIRVNMPKPNNVVSSPLTIEGEARGNWYFEASFPVEIVDANGNRLGIVPAQAEGEWMTTDFVPFKTVLNFNAPTTATGELILHKNNPSGEARFDDQLRIPVRFASGSGGENNQLTLKVFFGKQGVSDVNCEDVVERMRKVPETQSVGRIALEELLKGPTSAEKQDGYFTSINPGVTIKSLTIENGVARADFSEELGQNVAGSCRVIAIRSQIEETLKQFSSVKQVVISIEGKSEDILQP